MDWMPFPTVHSRPREGGASGEPLPAAVYEGRGGEPTAGVGDLRAMAPDGCWTGHRRCGPDRRTPSPYPALVVAPPPWVSWPPEELRATAMWQATLGG